MLECKHLETIKYNFHAHLKGSRNWAKMEPMIKPHDTLPIICAKVSRASYQKFYTTLFILHINSSVVILLGIAKKNDSHWTESNLCAMFVVVGGVAVFVVQEPLSFFFLKHEKQTNCLSWHAFKSRRKTYITESARLRKRNQKNTYTNTYIHILIMELHSNVTSDSRVHHQQKYYMQFNAIFLKKLKMHIVCDVIEFWWK